MSAAPSSAEPLLSVRDLSAGYGHVGVLVGVSLDVLPGRWIAIVGSNGAGKSTLLRTISGLIRPSAGEIRFAGRSIGGCAPEAIVRLGLLHVAEGRRLFRLQSVLDNLQLGAVTQGLARAEERRRLDAVFELFPILAEKKSLVAGGLSGGQQQMLAIGQALMREPRLLMLDEPSLGLAPVIVDQVFDVLARLRASGCAIVLVEQLVERALEAADVTYVMQTGRVAGRGDAESLRDGDLLKAAYLGGQR